MNFSFIRSRIADHVILIPRVSGDSTIVSKIDFKPGLLFRFLKIN